MISVDQSAVVDNVLCYLSYILYIRTLSLINDPSENILVLGIELGIIGGQLLHQK